MITNQANSPCLLKHQFVYHNQQAGYRGQCLCCICWKRHLQSTQIIPTICYPEYVHNTGFIHLPWFSSSTDSNRTTNIVTIILIFLWSQVQILKTDPTLATAFMSYKERFTSERLISKYIPQSNCS